MGQKRRRSGQTKVSTGTFLFTDLVGSTELIQRLGDDVSDPLIRNHLRTLRTCTEAYGGRVVKSLGDGLMSVFESSAAAVDAAVTMQQSIENLGTDASAQLGLRVGIHTGEATWDGEDFYGMPVWTARRLCDAASGGEILCSSVVREVIGTRGSHTFQPAGEFELKGVSEPVQAWRIVWEPSDQVVLPAAPRAGRGGPLLTAGVAVVAVAAVAALSLQGADEETPPAPRQSSPVPSPTPTEIDLAAAPLEVISVRDVGSAPPSGRDEDSSAPSVASDGSVAFVSHARLERRDTNGFADVYLRDPADETTTFVTAGANGPSSDPVLSTNGKVLAFVSEASNLVEGDTNGFADVFAYRVDTQAIQLVSVRNNGVQARGPSSDPAVSADGSVIAFVSEAANLAVRGDDGNGVADIFVHESGPGRTRRVSLGGGTRLTELDAASTQPAISADGHSVAFVSRADNVVRGDDNEATDVFLWRDEFFETSLVSRGTAGDSADGGSFSPSVGQRGDDVVVAFASRATNLVDESVGGSVGVYIGGDAELRSLAPAPASDAECYRPVLSSDARRIAVECVTGDAMELTSIWFHDLRREIGAAVSVTDRDVALAATTPAISGDGSFVAFVSDLAAFTGKQHHRGIDAVFAKGPLR